MLMIYHVSYENLIWGDMHSSGNCWATISNNYYKTISTPHWNSLRIMPGLEITTWELSHISRRYAQSANNVWMQVQTRQSEMANTSPATCQCLATFTPLKSKMLIFFSWRHFSARSSCYIINWYGYPRGSHEKYLKEIVCPVFEIRYWIVTCHHYINLIHVVGLRLRWS